MSKARPGEREEIPPADWRGAIGLGEKIARLSGLVGREALPSVILFHGRAGVGKRALASATAAMAFCDHGRACGDCDPCHWVLSGRHPEVLWVETRDARLKVEDAEGIQDFLSLNPGGEGGGKWRVAVIVDAEKLGIHAANRLLKTLEEPPPHGRILLTTSRPKDLLDTILSRCVRWHVPPPDAEETRLYLAGRIEEEWGRAPSDEELSRWMRLSGLAPERALEIARESSEGGPKAGELLTGDLAERLRHAGDLAKDKSLGAAGLADALEIALNDLYRDAAQSSDRSFSHETRPRRWRLREIRRLGRTVPLNPNLSAEALALAGFPSGSRRNICKG